MRGKTSSWKKQVSFGYSWGWQPSFGNEYLRMGNRYMSGKTKRWSSRRYVNPKNINDF